VLGHRSETFSVEGHHFALVLVDDLEPASMVTYDVRLNGRPVWPPDDGRPAPAVHTRDNERRVRLAFGSCRVGDPQPSPAKFVARTGVDARWAYSRQLQRGEVEWPDGLLLLGDQVYADEVSPLTAEFIRARRDVREPPEEEVADFEEYTRLYRESWSDPDIRWLLSTVPSVMIFDDHDVNDDWNISWSWIEEMRRQPWEERITGAFMPTGSTSTSETSPHLSSRRRNCSGASAVTMTPAPAYARWRGCGMVNRPHLGGPTTATSGIRGSWSSTPVPRACSATAAGR
jgi:PhoD-like phosphatase